MDPVYLGNTVPAVDQLLPIGNREKGPDTQPSARTAMNATTQSRFSLPPISHEYEKDGDRMQCWVCGNWYHI